ncbi:MAG: cell division protein FtsL [Gammaproteobacteria bacterium]|jgi:cell division protein FtsL
MNIFFSFILTMAVFISALQIVMTQHQARKTFMEVQQLEMYRNELNEEWGRLQLEQSTWATDDRLERIAREQLGMNNLDTNSIVLLRK